MELVPLLKKGTWHLHQRYSCTAYRECRDAPDDEAARELAVVEYGVSKDRPDRLLAVKIVPAK
jgi:hypothetical protein